jgi:Ion channel
VLIASYLLSAFSGLMVTDDLQVAFYISALLLALRTSPLPSPWPALIAIGALAGSGAAAGAALTGTKTGAGVADLWKALLLLLTAILIVRRVLARPAITIRSIYGALSAYLIVGLMFAACYAAIQHLGHAPFFADHQPGTTQTFQYFSFTTLTTLGYGDFTAAGNGGRAVAVIEALSGQVFLATLVARLVSAYGASGPRNGPPGRRPPRGIGAGTTAARRGRRPGSARASRAVTPRAGRLSGRRRSRRPETDSRARSDRRKRRRTA